VERGPWNFSSGTIFDLLKAAFGGLLIERVKQFLKWYAITAVRRLLCFVTVSMPPGTSAQTSLANAEAKDRSG
jgi:hypothetical protein